MEVNNSFCIGFSGITIRFRLPSPAILPDEFLDLQIEDPGAIDEEYEICLLTSPLEPQSAPICDNAGIFIYKENNGELRIHTTLSVKDGCQTACLLSPEGKNKLYYPASMWDHYSDPLNCRHLIGGEVILLKRNAFLLHSSVVEINGKTVLFSGPSGIGKSTMADLWVKHLGADLLNGDRCVVMEKKDGFYGGGSPWCGTSGIYRREQAPIAGIILLKQAPENSLHRLGIRALAPMFSQTIINSWDTHFMTRLTELYSRLIESVPIYQLNCRPDEEAVRLVYSELF